MARFDMVKAILCVVALIWATLAAPAFAQPLSNVGQSENVQARLISERTIVTAGETFHIAIDKEIARNWHTYWRNPGDSGEPTNINWTLPQGVTASAIKWPAPAAIPFGPLVNYGFSDQVTLPVAIQVPASATPGQTLEMIGDVTWLECSDICIPGGVKLALRVQVGANSQTSPDAPIIARALAALPKPFDGKADLIANSDGTLKLEIAGQSAPRVAYFFPYEVKNGALIDFAQPQTLARQEGGFALTMVRSPSFPQDLTGPIGGVLVLGQGGGARAFDISAPFENAGAGTSPPTKASQAAPAPMAVVPDITLLGAIGLAFLGGLILNLMPCVFPILSMKILSLVQASHQDAHAARAHGLWYGAGVIVSFLALAGVLIGLQAAGQAAGWGFQLQNPAIVIGLAVIMTLVGFNLLGFFEIGSSLQGIGNGAIRTGSAQSSVMTGFWRSLSRHLAQRHSWAWLWVLRPHNLPAWHYWCFSRWVWALPFPLSRSPLRRV
ncbi:MAG: hypothetical protein HC777_01210 [Hyphomonadaceae bacterium]|nr:hypothetical protein [Hyphomonadaceae bacterium]